MKSLLVKVGRGLVLAAFVCGAFLVVGSLENSLLWNHITPRGFNEWWVLASATVAGFAGFAWGFTDKGDPDGTANVDALAERFEGALDRFWNRMPWAESLGDSGKPPRNGFQRMSYRARFSLNRNDSGDR